MTVYLYLFLAFFGDNFPRICAHGALLLISNASKMILRNCISILIKLSRPGKS